MHIRWHVFGRNEQISINEWPLHNGGFSCVHTLYISTGLKPGCLSLWAGRCVLVCARACVWVEGVLLRPGAPGLLLSRGKVIRTDFVRGQRSNSVVLLTASLKIKCSANRSKRAWKGKLPPKLIRAFIIPSQVAERQVCGQHQGNTWSISEGAVSIKL